jgi:hypothetical protein
MNENTEVNEVMDTIKAVYDDGEAEINGRTYQILNLNHYKRLKVFGYFTKVKPQIEHEDFSFMGADEWREIEKILGDNITFNGDLVSKIPKHFEEFPEDYLDYSLVMMGVFSYPFLKGKITA